MSATRGRKGRHSGKGGGKGGGHRAEVNKIYEFPLPLLLEPKPATSYLPAHFLGLSCTRILNPHCEGIFDPATRSVWITNSAHSSLLWRRGFFGKGNLSRSEPSWLARQLNARKGGATAEEITARRRAERQQFKRDRAHAIAAAAMEAEAAFATHGTVPAESSVVIPSGATWKSHKPDENTADDDAAPAVDAVVEDVDPPEELEDAEHLQLTLQEAFFLLWSLDCLYILDATTLESLSLRQIWLHFQRLYYPDFSCGTVSDSWLPTRFDNPFLINYAVYHHYRSLGWVIRGGIKFCVDYLLYKRGPVFQHAEFALVVCPFYEDEADKNSSPFQLQNFETFTWTWLNTINRVNSQVQKTLVLIYVTVPAESRVAPDVLTSPKCLSLYSVREVVLRRFAPARMRD